MDWVPDVTNEIADVLGNTAGKSSCKVAGSRTAITGPKEAVSTLKGLVHGQLHVQATMCQYQWKRHLQHVGWGIRLIAIVVSPSRWMQ